jgi:hypothetical protein
MGHPFPIGSTVSVDKQEGKWTVEECDARAKDFLYTLRKLGHGDNHPWLRREWARDVFLLSEYKPQ